MTEPMDSVEREIAAVARVADETNDFITEVGFFMARLRRPVSVTVDNDMFQRLARHPRMNGRRRVTSGPTVSGGCDYIAMPHGSRIENRGRQR